jgi:murein DD-endopeptidase MepM/ murein hydrolase activator NlpD
MGRAATLAAVVSLGVISGVPAHATADQGGAQAPSVPGAGGSEFGVDGGPPVASRPVLREFSVPRRAKAGGPPQITLRVDELGTPSVRARVVILGLPSHRAALRIDLGEIATGRSVPLAWPRSARLRPGSYLVQFHAYDPSGATLLRRSPLTGNARMTLLSASRVSRPSRPVTPSGPTPHLTPPSFTPTLPGASQGKGVFPVAGPHDFGPADGRFGARRNGHLHQGQDVLAAEGTPVLAPLSGTIIAASYQAGGAGDYVTEQASDGRSFFFAHCEAASTRVAAGEAVSAGQQLCRVGRTGDASGPHLHFEEWIGGWHAPGSYPIDPLPDLRRWEAGG